MAFRLTIFQTNKGKKIPINYQFGGFKFTNFEIFFNTNCGRGLGFCDTTTETLAITA